jgi:hypothetical protein
MSETNHPKQPRTGRLSVMPGLDPIRIKLKAETGTFAPFSSSSGLTRGSLPARTALIIRNYRASIDARVRPEHDRERQFRPRRILKLMPMRPDPGILCRRPRALRQTTGFAQADPRGEPEDDVAAASRPTANVNAGWYKIVLTEPATKSAPYRETHDIGVHPCLSAVESFLTRYPMPPPPFRNSKNQSPTHAGKRRCDKTARADPRPPPSC